MRKDYLKKSLSCKDLKPDPFRQFKLWLEEAKQQILEPNAMQLATATKDGKPSCRTVLLKKFDTKGFVFFTNYESRKGKELEENPFAYTTFLWKELERQVGIEGSVERISQLESETYFSSRPRGAQIAAWASRQDTPIDSRAALDAEYQRVEMLYKQKTLPLPSFWGGFRLIPTRFEFWQGRAHRLHDRFSYTLREDQWVIERLSP